MGTKYTKSAQTGDEGVALVSQIAAKVGAVFRPFEKVDLGIDGTIELLTDDRQPSGDLVLIQIKSGSSYIRGGRFYVDADKAHFETWAKYSLPVIGIVCDPSTDVARWVDISEHILQHPDAVASGPYSLEAPATQPFSEIGFAAFLSQFRRSTTTATRIDATPNLQIRPWTLADSGPTQVLLSAIALDYPGFSTWLAKNFTDHRASKKVVEIGSAIAAFSMWQAKDLRNIKLQTFMVGSSFRGTAIGQHLIYHELRTWALDPNVERVHVTVASNKTDLIAYFRMFGFRVEGFSPNRYLRTSNAAELVLAKHFVRETVHTTSDLQRMTGTLAGKVWGLVPTSAARFGVMTDDLAVPALMPALTVDLNTSDATVSPRIRLIDPGGAEVVRHDDESLMTEFYPLRIHLPDKRYVLVPIYPRWVQAMLSDSGPGTQLKLRTDNVYYCYPKVKKLLKGDLVIFYETMTGGGRGAAIGAAVVLEVTIAPPPRLYQAFSALGIYQLSDVEGHKDAQGHAMAIRFGLFEPFNHPIALSRIRVLLAKARLIPQGLTPISRDGFELVRSEGL